MTTRQGQRGRVLAHQVDLADASPPLAGTIGAVAADAAVALDFGGRNEVGPAEAGRADDALAEQVDHAALAQAEHLGRAADGQEAGRADRDARAGPAGRLLLLGGPPGEKLRIERQRL